MRKNAMYYSVGTFVLWKICSSACTCTASLPVYIAPMLLCTADIRVLVKMYALIRIVSNFIYKARIHTCSVSV